MAEVSNDKGKTNKRQHGTAVAEGKQEDRKRDTNHSKRVELRRKGIKNPKWKRPNYNLRGINSKS